MEGRIDGGTRALKVGLVAIVTLVAFESLAVITILPDIEADLGGIAWYGWVTTAFFLGTMMGIVFAGDQADRRGAGIPYIRGGLLFAPRGGVGGGGGRRSGGAGAGALGGGGGRGRPRP